MSLKYKDSLFLKPTFSSISTVGLRRPVESELLHGVEELPIKSRGPRWLHPWLAGCHGHWETTAVEHGIPNYKIASVYWVAKVVKSRDWGRMGLGPFSLKNHTWEWSVRSLQFLTSHSFLNQLQPALCSHYSIETIQINVTKPSMLLNLTGIFQAFPC